MASTTRMGMGVRTVKAPWTTWGTMAASPQIKRTTYNRDHSRQVSARSNLSRSLENWSWMMNLKMASRVMTTNVWVLAWNKTTQSGNSFKSKILKRWNPLQSTTKMWNRDGTKVPSHRYRRVATHTTISSTRSEPSSWTMWQLFITWSPPSSNTD